MRYFFLKFQIYYGSFNLVCDLGSKIISYIFFFMKVRIDFYLSYLIKKVESFNRLTYEKGIYDLREPMELICLA